MANGLILKTDFPGLKLFKRGKVRDLYKVNDAGDLLIVSTDRISAYDVILPNGVPRKGEVLNKMSLFWFDQVKDIVPNNIITADVSLYPASCQPFASVLAGRSVLVRNAEPLPIECVVRGYISGSGWKDYQKNGMICGIQLPEGLKESERFVEPIFTPSSKAEVGEHDENISFEEVCKKIGFEEAKWVRDKAIAVYKRARNRARERGIIIADTKMEFGKLDGKIVLIDELLTPDSSRFWPFDSYERGQAQKSYDKQFVRDYLLSLNWDQKAPAPSLPDDIIEKTSKKYLEAYRLLTGKEL